jgi:1-acyl-sn-glycerol-3-phosphate acyltransferase
MVQIRSLAFEIAFYVTTALFLILGSPLLLAPRSWAAMGLRAHGRTCLFLLKWIGGCDYDVRGRENLPDGPAVIVAKHQSAWETLAFTFLFRDPAIVMKHELTRIPVYGAFCRKFEHIIISRGRHAVALKQMVADARDCVADGRDIIIFAEGTRRQPGDPADYKPGYLALYSALDVPLVPVALNSGLFWPPRTNRTLPGRIVVDIAPAIAPGMQRAEAAQQTVEAIESRTNGLIVEAAEAFPQMPTIAAALKRRGVVQQSDGEPPMETKREQ